MTTWNAHQTPPNFTDLVAELKQAKNRAERAAEEKSQFLAQMSHEIRTPLTAMLGYAELIANPDLKKADHAEAVDALRNSGQHLLKILNDILDLSQVEAGRLAIEQIKCPPKTVVREVVSLMKARADQKQLPIITEFQPGVPDWILTDPTRLRQILANLISNAIKFSTQGEIFLRVRPVNQGVPPEFLDFEVIDSGIGMSEAQQKRLFQSYTQADETIHRRFGGTGLGLAISRQLAEMLGGTIHCESALGHGSRFTLKIATGLTPDNYDGETLEVVEPAPINPVEFEDCADLANAAVPAVPAIFPETPPNTQSGHANVLLVEDYADNRRLISFLLQKRGANVDEAVNGREAVEKLKAKLQQNEVYRLVLMDLQMPEMDGTTATKTAREMGYQGPIIALTAQTMDGDRESCLAVGCDGYLSKPIDPNQFWEVADRYLMPPE